MSSAACPRRASLSLSLSLSLPLSLTHTLLQSPPPHCALTALPPRSMGVIASVGDMPIKMIRYLLSVRARAPLDQFDRFRSGRFDWF